MFESRKLKEAWKDFIEERRFQMAITMSWNRSVSLERARKDIGGILRRIDRKILGSNFHRFPRNARTDAVFVFEGMGFDHVHAHSAWRAPEGRWVDLGKLFPASRGGIWNDVVDSGSYKVEAMYPDGRNDEIVGYLLKGQHPNSDAFEMVWADEFHPTKK